MYLVRPMCACVVFALLSGWSLTRPTRCPRGIYIEEKEKLEGLVAPAQLWRASRASPAGLVHPVGGLSFGVLCLLVGVPLVSFVPGAAAARLRKYFLS